MPMSMLACSMMVVERTDDPTKLIVRKNKYADELRGEVDLNTLNVFLMKNKIELEVIDERKTA
jgi:hypothetical protein